MISPMEDGVYEFDDADRELLKGVQQAMVTLQAGGSVREAMDESDMEACIRLLYEIAVISKELPNGITTE